MIQFSILLLVRYLAASFTVVKVLRQHPHCNTECCLSVIMMMNNALEDVTVFKPESYKDEDKKRENEEPCNPNNLDELQHSPAQ